MAERCVSCRLNKKKIYFDVDRARQVAKTLALSEQKTYCIYKESNAIAFTDAQSAIEAGYNVIEFLSQYQ